MTFKNDLILQLAAFVLIGFIVSIIAFTDNTKTPLQIDEHPQSFLLSSR